MNFYVRKLGHQELSYTEGKGGKQRGRYILFSKKFREFFPPFDLDLNDRSRLIGVIDDTSRKVTFCYFLLVNEPLRFTTSRPTSQGEKRMKAVGKVHVPQEAFQAVIRINSEE